MHSVFVLNFRFDTARNCRKKGSDFDRHTLAPNNFQSNGCTSKNSSKDSTDSEALKVRKVVQSHSQAHANITFS